MAFILGLGFITITGMSSFKNHQKVQDLYAYGTFDVGNGPETKVWNVNTDIPPTHRYQCSASEQTCLYLDEALTIPSTEQGIFSIVPDL